MKFQRIAQLIYGRPLLITPGGYSGVRHVFESRLAMTAEEFRATRTGEDISGGEVELDGMEIENGIARIPISGVVGQNLPGMAKGSGAVDSLDIRREHKQAMDDPLVTGILLEIDSPGGMVNGTPETFDQIRKGAETKQTLVFAHEADSGAYWIACGADRIFGTSTSTFGAIGVYLPWLDESRAFEAAGYKIDIIKSGNLKGTGFPGTSLSEEQRAYLQEQADRVGEMFRSSVESARKVDRLAMDGRSFLADQALELGLIDGIVSSVDDVLAMFS